MFRYLCIALLIGILASFSTCLASTKPVCVVDFTTESQELEKHASETPSLILTELAVSQRFTLVERQKLYEVLEEQGLQQKALVNPEAAVEVGGLLGARYMFIGELSGSPKKGKGKVQVTARLVDVKEGRTIAGWRLESRTSKLNDDSIQLARDILTVLFPPNRWKTSGRAFLVPGLLIPGEDSIVAKRTRSRYRVFLPLAIVALTGLAYTQHSYRKADDEYKEILDREYKTYAELREAKDKRDNRGQWRWIAIGATAGVWLVNVADAFLEVHLLNKRREGLQLEARMKSQDIQVLLAMRY